MPRDDERLASAARALRVRQGLLQADLIAPGRSRHFSRWLEGGEAGRLRLDDIRAHFARLGASVRVSAWWNGASLDRLLDERHATVIDAGIGGLQRFGWHAETEVTFSKWGERGSIDIFAAFESRRAVVVGEAKSEWGSLEETIRVLDAKERLAPKIAVERFGFEPEVIGVLLIFPESSTARRIAARHSATVDVAFPARNREIGRWLRKPTGRLRGMWFLSNVHGRGSAASA